MAIESEKLKILYEKPPTRCEICHKTDQYDPETNSCLRCLDINSEINKDSNNQANNLINDEDERHEPNLDLAILPTQENLRNINQPNTSYNRITQINHLYHYNLRAIVLMSLITLCLWYFFPAIYVTISQQFNSTSQTSLLAAKGQSTETPYEVELDLQNSQDNPFIILSLNNVTIVELNEEIVRVINGNTDAVKVEFSSASNKRLYFIGKKSFSPGNSSGNVILECKDRVFTLFFAIRDTKDSYEQGFNGLVKIKKQ